MFKRKTTAETAQRVIPFSRVLAKAPMTRADEVSTIRVVMVKGSCVLKMIWLQSSPWNGSRRKKMIPTAAASVRKTPIFEWGSWMSNGFLKIPAKILSPSSGEVNSHERGRVASEFRIGGKIGGILWKKKDLQRGTEVLPPWGSEGLRRQKRESPHKRAFFQPGSQGKALVFSMTEK